MHAAIVTAYKDFRMLEVLVEALKARDMRVFIHIDRRSNPERACLDRLRAMGCSISNRHRIFWGSYSHLSAIVDLMRAALADPEVTYIHVMSGQDFPIADQARIGAVCDGGILMSYEPLAATSEMVQDRFKFYKVFHLLERVRTIPRPIEAMSRGLQRLLRISRTGTRTYADIYKGMVWMSLPAPVARFTVSDRAALRFLRELRFSYIAEEFFFHTVVANSIYAPLVRQDDFRYTDWGPRDGLRPAILDLRDAPKLAASDALFARKFDSRISHALLDHLAKDQALV